MSPLQAGLFQEFPGFVKAFHRLQVGSPFSFTKTSSKALRSETPLSFSVHIRHILCYKMSIVPQLSDMDCTLAAVNGYL